MKQQTKCSTRLRYWRLQLLWLIPILAGCISYHELVGAPVNQPADTAVVERLQVTIETDVTSASQQPETAVTTPAADRSYRVNHGDILLVNIDGRVELSSSGAVAGTSAGRASGSRIDGDGYLRLPMIGRIQVAGLTATQIEALLVQQFSRYLVDPWVTVEIAEHRSQPLYLLGQFRNPGTHYLDRPHNLLAGISLGGGTLDSANLRSARLIRDNQTQPVDIYRLLQEGAMEQNIQLQGGDTIFVPDDKNQHVFVFGAVSRSGAVAMPSGRLNISQALASAGLFETRGQVGNIRIIRSLSPTRGELITIDHHRILRGQALPFELLEGDIIYVPRSVIGTWNQAIQDLLPSLQMVSAILQPFVSIKYLRNN